MSYHDVLSELLQHVARFDFARQSRYGDEGMVYVQCTDPYSFDSLPVESTCNNDMILYRCRREKCSVHVFITDRNPGWFSYKLLRRRQIYYYQIVYLESSHTIHPFIYNDEKKHIQSQFSSLEHVHNVMHMFDILTQQKLNFMDKPGFNNHLVAFISDTANESWRRLFRIREEHHRVLCIHIRNELSKLVLSVFMKKNICNRNVLVNYVLQYL
jgi:hypothetical protein